VLWWIDVHEASLWRLHTASGAVESRRLAKPPGSFALIEGGGVLIAFRGGLATLDEFGAAEPRWLAMNGLSLGDERFNDGKVDRRGRFWVGTLDRALSRPIGKLYRLDPPNSLVAVDTGFALSNGIGWSPDDRTMYFAETHDKVIYRYDFDPESGAATNRRVFARLDGRLGGPDGLTVDSEGGVWITLFDRACVKRLLPDGRVDQVVELPVSRATSCTLGGPDMRTLFVTTARYGLDAQGLAREPMAGGVLAVDVRHAGLVEPRVRLHPIFV